MIYFPSFEPSNYKWLKYSLLYMEELRPIVPQRGGDYISERFRRIQGDSDLIHYLDPDNTSGNRASTRAIQEVINILENPLLYVDILNSSRVMTSWKHEENWDSTVFSEKFNSNFTDFCLDNSLGRTTNEGLIMSSELAGLYLTILANELSITHQLETVTDNKHLDEVSIFFQTFKTANPNKLEIANSIIDHQVPKNLEEIRLEDVIRFRNQNRNLISQFNRKLNEILEKIERNNHQNIEGIIEDFNSINSELGTKLIGIGCRLGTLGIGVWMTINSELAQNLEYLKHLLGLGIVFASGLGLKSDLKSGRQNRFVRKYLRNLSQLK